MRGVRQARPTTRGGMCAARLVALPGAVLLLVVLAAGAAADQNHVLAKDRVVFAVDSSWVKVGGRDDRTVVFQVPNPADEGTPDSANVAVSVVTNASRPFEASVERVSASGVVVTRLPRLQNAHDVFLLSSGRQGATAYILVDRLARRG